MNKAFPNRPLFVHLLPELIPPAVLKGSVAVVLDVLRATSVMVQALEAGCVRIIPCLEVEDALSAASKFDAPTVILGGERSGLPIDGFDLGNSPSAYDRSTCRGKTLVMTTTNGTRAILSCLEAERILIAAFSNASSVVEHLRNETRPVHIVCAGTDRQISYEDTLLAGLLSGQYLQREAQNPHRLGSLFRELIKVGDSNDAALLACRAWNEIRTVENATGKTLAEILGEGKGGNRLRDLGLYADIESVAAIDRTGIVVELKREPFLQIVANA